MDLSGNQDTPIGDRVLDFYRALPFNTYSSIEDAAFYVARSNQLRQVYKDLDSILGNGMVRTCLDAGCGGGWLANTVAHHYEIETVGIDFNAAAITIASDVAKQLDNPVTFTTLNLFDAKQLGRHFDVVASIGVLHHTGNPLGGINVLSELVAPNSNARLYIGLYHLFGRRPFLNIFDEMHRTGKSRDEMFTHYRSLHQQLTDERHLESWFRDQVLHPHESQHTLKEIAEYLHTINFEVESTSINNFEPIDDLERLFIAEKEYEHISYQRNCIEGRYFPGFFTVCARRK